LVANLQELWKEDAGMNKKFEFEIIGYKQ